jgi:hypothetical protein
MCHLNASISAAASSVMKDRTCQSGRSLLPTLKSADIHLHISFVVLRDEITQAIGTPLRCSSNIINV